MVMLFIFWKTWVPDLQCAVSSGKSCGGTGLDGRDPAVCATGDPVSTGEAN